MRGMTTSFSLTPLSLSRMQEIADTFHVNNEELVSYELPALTALHFSLLTPIYQALTHFEKLRDKEISNK